MFGTTYEILSLTWYGLFICAHIYFFLINSTEIGFVDYKYWTQFLDLGHLLLCTSLMPMPEYFCAE